MWRVRISSSRSLWKRCSAFLTVIACRSSTVSDAALDSTTNWGSTTRVVWEAHKHVYDSAVREPMLALTAALADQFGTAKVFRPYRDVGSRRTTPYRPPGAIVQVGAAAATTSRSGHRCPGERWLRHAASPDLAGSDRHRALRPGARTDRRPAAEGRGFEIRGDRRRPRRAAIRRTTPIRCCATSRCR